MKINDLVDFWDATASGALTFSHYNVRLPIEDAATLAALDEMYATRTSEQLITDLLSAALIELESGMRYVEGSRVISLDEMGEPVYEDQGLCPGFIELTH